MSTFDNVLDALRDVHDEASLWRLADEITVIAPSGVQAVQQIHDAAKLKGIPTPSVNTLRLYRDVAHRFPVAERVPMVSFSAHRAALAVGQTEEAKKLLEQLAQNGKVTVPMVKKMVAARTGKAPAAKTASTATSAGAPAVFPTWEMLGAELAQGDGANIVAHIDEMLRPSHTLDELHKGLNKVLAAVDARRAKAARRAAQRKASRSKPTPQATPAKPAAAKPAAAKPTERKRKVGAGDLRGL